jgi:REP element-mobilizing transposase RayT
LGLIKNKKQHLYRIEGGDDHLHILMSMHPAESLAEFVKQLKISTSNWIKENKIFPDFSHWQEGYGAFTLSMTERDALIDYIKNQEEHHKKFSFMEELRKLLTEAKIEYDERYIG